MTELIIKLNNWSRIAEGFIFLYQNNNEDIYFNNYQDLKSELNDGRTIDQLKEIKVIKW